MTRATVHAFNPARGTGTLCCVHGTHVPFSSRDDLRVGDAVTFRLVGGIAGLYAIDVEGPRQRQTATSPSGFRWRSGTWAPSAG